MSLYRPEEIRVSKKKKKGKFTVELKRKNQLAE